ncbi:hypothetical protein QB898_11305 [Ottowia sp. 10c7w1]|uniref:Uncharacterized protein n=1 Tax=Ottowia cancrivicina TaxID=3040346 RepID=A0AAW6RR94_9BURK|nr:hypothetical protein [Ottowia sp. 10c7w1]
MSQKVVSESAVCAKAVFSAAFLAAKSRALAACIQECSSSKMFQAENAGAG